MRQRSQTVFWLFLAGLLCLAGAPLTGGFFSKDLILASAYAQGNLFHLTLYGLGLLTAGITSLYSFRLAYLVFAGDYRGDELPDQLPGMMLWPLLPLAIFGLFGGLLNLPHLFGGDSWLSSWLNRPDDLLHLTPNTEYLLFGAAGMVFLLGWLIAHLRYFRFQERPVNPLSRFLLAGWHFDALYERTLVRPFTQLCHFCRQGVEIALIEGLLAGGSRLLVSWGEALRLLTNGRLIYYLQGFVWGLLIIVGWFLLQAVI